MAFSMSGDVNRDVTITFIGKDRASSAMRSISGQADRTTKTATKLSGALKAAGIAAATALAAAAAAAGYFAIQFVKSAVTAAGNFEQSMNVMQNALGATGKEMKDLEKFALRMGSQTVFSAQEASDAMIELAKAGMTQAQIKGGALAATMDVAATEGLELADTAVIVSNAMGAFGLSAKEATGIADALAGASGASTASVRSLSIALSQSSAVAADAGFSLNETAGALALLDQNGIKGSDAGTSLKTMLMRLVPQTDATAKAFDQMGLNFVKANGEFKSMIGVADELESKLGDMSDAERSVALQALFGADARRAATILVKEGADGLRKMIQATREEGAAAKMAQARMKGWNGAVEQLSGAWETFKIKFGRQILPMLARFVTWIAKKAVPWISGKLVPAVKGFTTWIREEAVPWVKKLVDRFQAKGGFFDALSDTWGKVLDLAGALGRLVGAISGKGDGAKGQGANDSTKTIADSMTSMAESVGDVAESIQSLIDKIAVLEEKWNFIKGLSGPNLGESVDPRTWFDWAKNPPDWFPGGSADGGWLKRRGMGGWTMVGEHGPELINNRGFVKTHSQSMGAGGAPVVININGAIDPVGTARQIERILAKGGRVMGRSGLATA